MAGPLETGCHNINNSGEKKGGVYLDLKGLRVAVMAVEDFTEAGAKTDAEKQKGRCGI